MNSLSFVSTIFENKIWFGGYPNQEWFSELQNKNVKLFINLTTESEMISKQLFHYYFSLDSDSYSNYPILDNNIPNNRDTFIDFFQQILSKIKKLKDSEKVYIHCRGGHGRSGMVVACLLCHLLNIIPEKSLLLTTLSHSNRPMLKLKYKNIKCPQIFLQRKFVIDFCKPIIVSVPSHKKTLSYPLVSYLHRTKLKPLISYEYDTFIVIEILLYIREYILAHSKYL